MKTTPTGYTVSIEDITEPASYAELADALAALWATLRTLPLGWTQFEAYRFFFGPGAAERTREFLARDGHLELSFVLLGRSRLIRVVPRAEHPLQPAAAALRLRDSPEVAALRLSADRHEAERAMRRCA